MPAQRLAQRGAGLGIPQPQRVVNTTGRALDVALTGNAWLAVQGRDGTEAYTRAGALEVNPEGLLVNSANGLSVQGDGGPITMPANADLVIAADRTITAKVGNAKPQGIGRLKLVTPDSQLQRGEDGLFRAADGDLAADPNARLQAGALGSSNVSPVAAMVAMIAAARQFEQQMKMMQTAQEVEQNANKLLASG